MTFNLFDSILISLALILPICYYLLAHRIVYPQPLPGIPYNQTASHRILGDIPDLVTSVRRTKETSSWCFSQCRRLKSPVIQLFLRPFSKPFVFVDDARETEDMLLRRTREFDRAPSTAAFFRTVLPRASIVKPTDHEFKAQRRLWVDVMSPAFLRTVVAPNIYRSTLELVELWRLKSRVGGGRPFEAHHDLETAAFDAIWVAVLGSELGGIRSEIEAVTTSKEDRHQNQQQQILQTQQEYEDQDQPAHMPGAERSDLYEAIQYLNKSVERIMASPMPVLHHWLIRQTPTYRRYETIKNREILRILKSAYARFKALKLSSNLDSHSQEEANEQHQHDTCAMDLVLRREMISSERRGTILPPPEENLEMQDELLMLLVAGHETTANTLSWFVKFMAHHPSSQDRLRQHLRAAFPSSTASSPPSAAEILSSTTSIPYLDATIAETNRLAATVPLIVRVTTVDTHILGFAVPKGTHVMCNSRVTEPYDDMDDSVVDGGGGDLESRRSESSRVAMEKRLKEGLGGAYQMRRDLDRFEPERWLVKKSKLGKGR
ncbi:hypothetical protein N0V85_001188 [Neurospora sp. IMI 360204]|nr:hypothetical protein N0V85_001188 [Neurospora sp. IMI 360204]